MPKKKTKTRRKTYSRKTDAKAARKRAGKGAYLYKVKGGYRVGKRK